MVIKNTFLSNSDNASRALRQELLTSCNLFAVLDCPGGTFIGAGVKTVVLFFEKGAPTRKIWYYQLDPGRNMGKTNALNDEDLAEFVALQRANAEGEKSWLVDRADVDGESFDLSVKNPNAPEAEPLREPRVIMEEIAALDRESAEILAGIGENVVREGWVKKKLGDVCTLQRGFDLPKRLREKGKYPLISSSGCIDSHTEAKVSGPGVVTGRSGSIGSTFFIDKDFWPLNTTLYVKDFLRQLDPQFVFRLLEKFDLKSYASGAGVPTLNRNNVQSESVIVPSAVSEQKRIVAILDEVFAGIDDAIANTEKNLTNARELFESSLQIIFSERGKSWMRLTLLELLERKWITSHLDGNHGGDYPKKNEFVRSGIPYISANCLKNESIDISLAKYLTPERAASLRKGIAKDNDVLFAHNATVGPVTILHTEEEKVILSTSLTYYRCDPTQILPEYLAHYMRSKEFKVAIRERDATVY